MTFMQAGESIASFGALGNSNGTSGNGADDTAAIQSAINAAISTGTRNVYIPSLPAGRCYRTTATLNLTESVNFFGDGMEPAKGAIGVRGPGSWLYFDHANGGLFAQGGNGYTSGGQITGIGTIRNQPLPRQNWVPNPIDYDITLLSGDWYVDNVCFWNPTNALHFNYAGFGRLRVGYIYGNPFLRGIKIDRCLDYARVENVHWWPYSTFDANIAVYKLRNFIPLEITECDGAHFENFFAIGMNRVLLNGTLRDGRIVGPKDITFGKAYFDLVGDFGIYVDSSCPDGASLSVAQLVLQGGRLEDQNPDGAIAGIVLGSNKSQVTISSARISYFNNQVAVVNGNDSTLYMGADILNGYNSANNMSTAYAVTGARSKIVKPALSTVIGGGNGAPVIDTSGRISAPETIQSVVTPGATNGTLGAASGSVRYTRNGNWIQAKFTVTITSTGSATGGIVVPLPIPALSGQTYELMGEDFGLSGKIIRGRAFGSNLLIYDYANAFPAGNGSILNLSGVYEADPL